jgi:hypothetical protein
MHAGAEDKAIMQDTGSKGGGKLLCYIGSIYLSTLAYATNLCCAT